MYRHGFEESGMPFRTLRLAGAALIAAALLTPTAASAQYYSNPAPYYGDGYGHDRDRRDRDGYDRQGYARDSYDPPPPPRRTDYRRPREQCDRGSAGTILGAIAGGLLGNAAIGRHGNHAAGTLAGAGAGALVGHTADRDCD
jgi:hypothetical protein